jgi:MFS family permease
MKRIPPWLTLLALAPLLGEIVSGHQPPLEACNPLSVILLMLPYGLGALVCRELVRRWRKGWLSLLLLGVAYAFYEEAIVVRSFFDPNWGELGILKQYHIFGVNWTYAMMLIHFHVLISIAASVYLAEMLHPERREESWLGNGGLAACVAGLALWLPAGWLMTAYVPPWPLYVLSAALVAGLILAARSAPANLPAPAKKRAPRPFFFLLLGFANMILFFAAVYALPGIATPPLWLSILGLILLDALTLGLLLLWSGNGFLWDDRRRLAWIAGGLGFFLLFGFASDLEGFAGRSCVGATGIFALIIFRVWVNRHTRREISLS